MPNRNAAKGWIAVTVSGLAQMAAAMTATIGIASECTTPHEVNWWIAGPFFALFAVTGAYVMAVGGPAQRMVLFLGSAIIVAAYVGGVSLSLPMIIETEIGCAAAGQR